MREERNYEFSAQEGLRCNGEYIADFQICVIDKQITVFKRENKRKVMYCLEVTREDGSTISKWTDDLKKIRYFEMFGVDDTFLTEQNKKLLLSKLLREASKLSPKLILSDESGLRNIEGKLVYKLKEDIIFEAARKQIMIPVHNGSDEKEYKNLSDVAVEYINLLPGVTEPIFFFSLFTIVKPFVERLNISCGFALALVGPPCQLKTSLARKYCLWVDWGSENEVLFTEKIYEREIIRKLDNLAGLCFLIDDLRRMTDSNENKNQMSRLDHIVRHVNAAHSDCANVVITGETLGDMGIFSCLDRIFQVKMQNLSVEEVESLKRKLSELPANLMRKIAVEFAKSLMRDVNKVNESIECFYQNNAFQPHATGEYATRTKRHAMFIRMAEHLFSQFCMKLNMEEQLRSALEIQSKIYEVELVRKRVSEQPRDYVVDFYETFVNHKVLPLYTNRYDYYRTHEEYAYLIERRRLYINTMALERGLKVCCGRHIAAQAVVKMLSEEGILIDPSETGNVRGKQVKLGEKGWHYAFDLEMLIERLVERGYAVPEKVIETFCG